MNKDAIKSLFALLLVLLLSGCKTKYVAVPEYHTRDSLVVRYQHDSVFTHDSVFVNQYVKGDTVVKEVERTRYLYRNTASRDTVQVATRDTVAKPVIVEKKVTEYKWRTHWYDGICRRFTCAILVAIAAIIIAWLVKKKMKR